MWRWLRLWWLYSGVNSGNPVRQLRAVRRLAKFTLDEAAPLLVAALHIPDSRVREASAASLRTLNWSPSSISDQIHLAIAECRFTDAAALGKDAVVPLLTLGESIDPVASKALAGLRTTSSPEAVSSLVHIYRNSSDRQSPAGTAVAAALKNCGGTAAVELVSVPHWRSDPGFRKDALDIIQALGESAREALQRCWQSKSMDARHAHEALQELGDPATRLAPQIEYLLKLGDPFPIAELGKDAVAPLIAVLMKDDSHPRILEAAADALVLLDDPRAVKPMLWSATRQRATVDVWQAYVKNSHKAVRDLSDNLQSAFVEAMSDPDPELSDLAIAEGVRRQWITPQLLSALQDSAQRGIVVRARKCLPIDKWLALAADCPAAFDAVIAVVESENNFERIVVLAALNRPISNQAVKRRLAEYISNEQMDFVETLLRSSPHVFTEMMLRELQSKTQYVKGRQQIFKGKKVLYIDEWDSGTVVDDIETELTYESTGNIPLLAEQELVRRNSSADLSRGKHKKR